MVTTAEAGGRGPERSRGAGWAGGGEMQMKGKPLEHAECCNLGHQGHQIKVWEQRKKWRKYILLEIDVPAVVRRAQESRVT